MINLIDLILFHFFISGLAGDFLNSNVTLHSQRCIALLYCLLKRLDAFTIDIEDRAVEITVGYLKKFLLPDPKDTVSDNKTIFCVVDYLWEAIRTNETFREKFLKKGGVFHILDLLQVIKLIK